MNKGVISNFGRGQDQNETDVSTVKSSVEDTVKNSFLGFSGDKISDEDRDKLLQHTNITIINDENMPYTDDGPVDILLNASAVVRRLISEPMFEVEINFIANEIRKKICTLETMEEKEDMIFGFLSMINEYQCSFFHNMYNGFDKVVEMNGKRLRLLDHQAKVDFIHDVEENGFYLIKPPDACIRYESIKALYDKFDFIKPVPLYIDLYGVKHRKMIKEGIVGSMFMIILKQNSRKNAVARSTFRVNRSNLPAKDAAKKTNRAPYSKSPIKLSEIYNLFSSISGSTLTSYNMFMRSSPIARKSLDRIIATDNNPLAIKKLKLQNNYINANAEILNARLKSIGIKLQFLTDKDETPDVLEDVVMPLSVHGYTIYDSPLNKPMYNTLFKYYDKYLESVSIVQSYEGEKQDIAWREVFNLKEVKDMKIPKNVKDILVNTTKGIIDVSDNNISEDDDEESDVSDSTVTEETDSDSDD